MTALARVAAHPGYFRENETARVRVPQLRDPQVLDKLRIGRVGRTRLAIISRILVKDKTASDHFF
jgi:hypothetical protein